jgi:dihydrofolate reductase
MSLSLVAALANGGVIGLRGDMPWGRSLKADLKRFKAVTLGHPVIMGRKTWDSLAGKALVERTNIVVSRQALDLPAGVLGAGSLEAALALAEKAPGGEEPMLIGGGQLYAQAWPLARRLYLTRILKDFEGDTYFPEWAAQDWAPIGQARGGAEGDLRYEFLTLQRSTVR